MHVREVDSDGEVESEFNVVLNDVADGARERTSCVTAVVLENSSPVFPFETKTLSAAKIIHHIGRTCGKLR